MAKCRTFFNIISEKVSLHELSQRHNDFCVFQESSLFPLQLRLDCLQQLCRYDQIDLEFCVFSTPSIEF